MRVAGTLKKNKKAWYILEQQVQYLALAYLHWQSTPPWLGLHHELHTVKECNNIHLRLPWDMLKIGMLFSYFYSKTGWS